MAASDRAVDPLGPDALDFWLGEWDLAWGDAGDGSPTGRGTNRIERTVGGRVIQETFEGHGPRGTLHGFRELPVKLKVHDSVFVPLAKWAMLLAGNYRCVQADTVRPIKEAVHGDLAASRAVYEWVVDLCVALGASRADLVPFEKYAAAAQSLGSPSSAARALAAGAQYIERVDRLVQAVAAQKGMRNAAVDETVALVDDWLVRNRRKG